MKAILLALCLLAALPAQADCVAAAFQETATDPSRRPVNVAKYPALNEDAVTVGATSVTLDDPLPANTYFVLLKCDAKTHYSVGVSPTASSANLWAEAGETVWIGIDSITYTIALIDG